MADEKKDTFTAEVNNRLGEFFGSMDKSDAPAQIPKPSPPKNSELFNLKAIVLSIEWEITDEIMDRLMVESDRLLKIYRDHKVVHSLLKLLDAVGKYINAKKATAHPDSIQLLHSIHANLQRVTTSDTITETQSNQILSAEIAKFKKLKQQLLTKIEPPLPKDNKPIKKAKAQPLKVAVPVEQPLSAVSPEEVSTKDAEPIKSSNLPKEPVLTAIDELKRIIKEEFKTLREELRQLRR